MILVRVDQDEDFKNCCMSDGKFDGSQRHYYFQRVTKRAARWPPSLLLSHVRLDIDYISRFFTSNAFSSMNLRRASTSSPISVVKMASVSAMSSSLTERSVRRSGSIVVSHSCVEVISPSPL